MDIGCCGLTDNTTNGDLSLMHNLYVLKEGLPQFKGYDRYYSSIGSKLLKEDINNPYANNYMADYYRLNDNLDSFLYPRRRVEKLLLKLVY
jgi:hypothetical protein